MTPILLIHGYSAEAADKNAAASTRIYAALSDQLRALYGAAAVFELDVGNYVTLEDGLTLDDIAFALDRGLRADFAHLLQAPFNVIVHSTGALVVRNWLRRFGRQYADKPVRRVIYLAGALFGSGWAHIGKGQLAKWARFVFQGGADRGVHVLDALELGASWTIDLHIASLGKGATLFEQFGAREAAIIGSEPHPSWFPIPVRYAKEDGSDGVVRVSAGNPNFSYVAIRPTDEALTLDWATVEGEIEAHQQSDLMADKKTFYQIVGASIAGISDREQVPIAVAYGQAHTGATGIVQAPSLQVMTLIRAALESADANWTAVIREFTEATAETYQLAAARNTAPIPAKWLIDSRSQYDGHSQVVFRLRDQDGRPVEHFDIYFNNVGSVAANAIPFGDLMQDKHVNEVTPNCICFYLRATRWNGTDAWVDQVAAAGDCFLEITAVEPDTDRIRYLPLRLAIASSDLAAWVTPHVTTVVDVELLRLPAPELFIIQSAT